MAIASGLGELAKPDRLKPVLLALDFPRPGAAQYAQIASKLENEAP